MRKYLMTGVAAIALCAAFTSCSKGDELYDADAAKGISTEQEIASVYNNYNQAFIKTFGQVNPNVDWGFGNGAKTRGLSDKTAGANKERNLWAATDNVYNLLVPTPLTAQQKLRVQKYFQAHPNLTWEAPTMTNYFVQQVYKGNPSTAGDLSAEQYPQGNGTTVKSSDHMNKLTVGGSNEHVLDFNNGDNPNNAKDVKNNGTLTNDDQYHSDQITLIIGIQPTCVGFHVTEGNVQHNECMALAGAKAIDDWARAQTPVIGEDVWYGTDQYGYENSSWNRSFVGLDYEQLTLEQCSTNNNVKISHFQKDWVWDGSKLWKKSDYIATNGDDFKYNNNVVKYVTSNTNEICATNVDEAQQTWYLTRMDASQFGGNSSEEVIDLTRVKAKLDTNSYPVENGGLQKWVKNIGGRDYVYSDWIVTLTPAQENVTPTTKKVRIMAEDLNAQAADGDIENSDWDFNDVVFDVEFDAEGDGGTITLICAGGVLPLKVAGEEVHLKFDSSLTLDEKGWYPMINTGKGMGIDRPQVSFHIGNADKANNGQAIKIEVQKTLSNGETRWLELTARKGQPCSKFAVKPTVQPCLERDHIDFVSDHAFTRYVANGGELIW
jgi:hypothetical protein